MANYINEFFFGIYPYVALTVFFVGSLLRYDRDQYTWKASSSQLLSKKDMRLGSNLFHIGVLFIIVGHVVGLLIPESVYHYVISTPAKQMLAMVSGGFFERGDILLEIDPRDYEAALQLLVALAGYLCGGMCGRLVF